MRSITGVGKNCLSRPGMLYKPPMTNTTINRLAAMGFETNQPNRPGLLATAGPHAGHFDSGACSEQATLLGNHAPASLDTPYPNTIPLASE